MIITNKDNNRLSFLDLNATAQQSENVVKEINVEDIMATVKEIRNMKMTTIFSAINLARYLKENSK